MELLPLVVQALEERESSAQAVDMVCPDAIAGLVAAAADTVLVVAVDLNGVLWIPAAAAVAVPVAKEVVQRTTGVMVPDHLVAAVVGPILLLVTWAAICLHPLMVTLLPTAVYIWVVVEVVAAQVSKKPVAAAAVPVAVQSFSMPTTR